MSEEKQRSKFYLNFIENERIYFLTYSIILKELEGFYKKADEIREPLKKGLEEDDWSDHYERIKDIHKDNLIPVEIKDLQLILKMTKGMSSKYMYKFLNRSLLLFLYTEIEQYFFGCFKYAIITNSPAILSKKQVSIKEIINNKKNFDLIIEEKAERIIHDQFYKNFEEIFEFAYEFLGIKVKFQEEDLKILEEFRQLRNAFIHGNGKVNLIYLSKIHYSNKKLGDKLEINIEIITDFMKSIREILEIFDEQLINQFPELKL